VEQTGKNNDRPSCRRKPFNHRSGPNPFFIRAFDQTKIHWHVEDKGSRHAYIKSSSPRLNGKIERSQRSDQQEFYQLLCYKDDVDLGAKLDEWKRFYNLAMPHGAHGGKAPYEALRDNLSMPDQMSR